MAWRSGSFSRTLLNSARSTSIRRVTATNTTSYASVRLRPPQAFQANLLGTSRRLSFTNPRTLGVLGCVESLMPLHSVVADSRLTSHVSVEARSCCELSHGFTKLFDEDQMGASTIGLVDWIRTHRLMCAQKQKLLVIDEADLQGGSIPWMDHGPSFLGSCNLNNVCCQNIAMKLYMIQHVGRILQHIEIGMALPLAWPDRKQRSTMPTTSSQF
ncbi:hypothetical protein Dimus_017202 [Dionaea muscipula]